MRTIKYLSFRVHLRMVPSLIPVFPEAILFSSLLVQVKSSKAGTKDLLGKNSVKRVFYFVPVLKPVRK
jgi:hypothetical protein